MPTLSLHGASLKQYEAVLKKVKGPILSKCGGRKFQIGKLQISMNNLTASYFRILNSKNAHLELPANALRAVRIVNRLKDLDQPLQSLTRSQRVRLQARQFWGERFAKLKYGLAFERKALTEITVIAIHNSGIRLFYKEFLPLLKKILALAETKKVSKKNTIANVSQLTTQIAIKVGAHRLGNIVKKINHVTRKELAAFVAKALRTLKMKEETEYLQFEKKFKKLGIVFPPLR